MPLPAKAFQRWLHGIAPPGSTADICRISGVKRTTLAQQLVRGKVAESTVVSISRAFNINPVAALATFANYSELAGSPVLPTPRSWSARSPPWTSCARSLPAPPADSGRRRRRQEPPAPPLD